MLDYFPTEKILTIDIQILTIVCARIPVTVIVMDNRLDCFKNSMAAGRFNELTIIGCSVSGSKHLSTGRSEIKIFSKIKPLKKKKLTHRFDHN